MARAGYYMLPTIAAVLLLGYVLREASNIQTLGRASHSHQKEQVVEMGGMYDPLLIDKIRGQILPPLSATQPSAVPAGDQMVYASQMGEDRVVDGLLQARRNGFFVECGAADGQTYSNSLLFELGRGWSGVLIEANSVFFTAMKSNASRKLRSRSYMLHACLSPTNRTEILKFNEASFVGGLNGKMEKTHVDGWKINADATQYIQCFPLYSVLSALNRTHVDYFSLDVEGAEMDILRTIPFNKLTFDVFTIEYAVTGPPELTTTKLAAIKSFFEQIGGYAFNGTISGLDVVFVRKQKLT